jgi:hypothetical protein
VHFIQWQKQQQRQQQQHSAAQHTHAAMCTLGTMCWQNFRGGSHVWTPQHMHQYVCSWTSWKAASQQQARPVCCTSSIVRQCCCFCMRCRPSLCQCSRLCMRP